MFKSLDSHKQLQEITDIVNPSREEAKEARIVNEIATHLDFNNRSLEAEHELIKNKESKLSFRCRQYIIKYFNN